MFKVNKSPKFSRPVDVMIPVDGGFEKQTFRVTFKVVADADNDDGHDLNTTAGSTAFLREAIETMDDLVGDDDKPMPYSHALRDELLKVPYVRAALARTYFGAVSQAALGN